MEDILSKSEADLAAKKMKRITFWTTIVVLVCVAAISGFFINAKFVMPAVRYESGQKAFTAGDYKKSIDWFLKVPHYKDSNEMILKACLHNIPAAKAGDTVYFGNFEQDNTSLDGKEAIAWKVLENKNGNALLISEKVLDCIAYNEAYKPVTWAVCSLRTWLDGDFLVNSFSASEKSAIKTTKVINKVNPIFNTTGGPDTYDEIFILSIEEAQKYFKNDGERKAQNTPYAIAKTNNPNVPDKEYGNWWLRSPGLTANAAACVDFAGEIRPASDEGSYSFLYGEANAEYIGVRPVLWINMKAEIFT